MREYWKNNTILQRIIQKTARSGERAAFLLEEDDKISKRTLNSTQLRTIGSVNILYFLGTEEISKT